MMPIHKTDVVYLAILIALLAVVFGLNWVAGGTITSPQNLAIDLVSPPESPQTWSMQSWVPTRYRVLFYWIVQASYTTFFSSNDARAFYLVFVSWSFIFFACALITFYFYLHELNFTHTLAFVGGLLFLASPPVTLAYKYPVYTREDPLAYFLVLLGLFSVFKRKSTWVCIISTLAALTRETTLIVPLAYLLTANDSWRKRILVCTPPMLAVIGIRGLMGFATYDPFEGSIYNFKTPWQTSAFLFCVFGILWIPFFVELINKRRNHTHIDYPWQVLTSTALIIFILVLGTQLALARAREIRIAFLMFPWVIPLALYWFRENGEHLSVMVHQFSFWTWGIGVFASLSLGILWLQQNNPDLMKFYLTDFKNGYWLALADLHLSATLALVVPLWLNQRKLETQTAR
ncbi:MAG: hypothetical protein HZB51_27200 [Chloroflexi bacterium]|nr:hypothetical protein [Chloroflexota bacterium]